MGTSSKYPFEKRQPPGEKLFDRTNQLGQSSDLKGVSKQHSKKPAWIAAAENERVRVMLGNIADCDTEALFFLNLKDTEFPSVGPVVAAILDRDDRDRATNKGKPIYDLILDAAKRVPNARMERDDGGGAPYDKAVFSSRPYEIRDVDVEEANWPHLRRIFFGNIGPTAKGVLVRRVMGWSYGNEKDLIRQQPDIKPLFTKLRDELGTLLKNLFTAVEQSGISSIGMPVLTGNRAPSPVFYETLDKVVRERKPNFDIKVYSRNEGEKPK